jgi:hypothetical protein
VGRKKEMPPLGNSTMRKSTRQYPGDGMRTMLVSNILY